MDKNKIYEMLNNNILDIVDIIYKAREDDLGTITLEDKKNLKEINNKINGKYIEYKNALANIPDEYKMVKREIIDKFNNYLEELQNREAYYNEKNYKTGFRDGGMLIINLFYSKK